MRKNLRVLAFIFFLCSLFSSVCFSQDNFAFAITDVSPSTANWTVLRKLNLQTGVYSDVLLNGADAKLVAYDARTKKQVISNTSSLPFGTGVAAIAYDKKNNRIYFTPMYIDQLRYIDLKTMKVYYVTGQPFAGESNPNNDDAKVISRMVIAPDGYGYAITNDANNFIRFSTGNDMIVEQLGALVDDPNNTGISIHNRCSSFGGDLVADDEGNLYLLSSSNSVFKINMNTKVATWLGSIKGLPANFTTNGVAVTDDGNVLAGSQVFPKSWYMIDPKSWNASEFKTPNGVYLTSDLANSNYLSKHAKTLESAQDLNGPNLVQLYPNPISITDNQFKIQFTRLQAGNYTIELTDVTGKQIMTQKVSVVNQGQIQNVNLKRITAQGIYLVKISDTNNRSVFTQKLVVQ